MLYSQGIALESLGIPNAQGTPSDVDPREAWRLFAANYFLFRGTPTRLWLDYVFSEIFGLPTNSEGSLSAGTADHFYDTIAAALQTPEFRPRALFDRFHIEVLATTDSPLSTLGHHTAIRASGWGGRVLPTFRPDPVIDAEFTDFRENLDLLGALAHQDTSTYAGYLNALRDRRLFFKAQGATATDHGHLTADTADLTPDEAAAVYDRLLSGKARPGDVQLFQAQMLTEMAAMSLDDGLTMQLHPGSVRNHNPALYARFGRDMGADIPQSTGYVHALRPLLNKFGNDPRLTLILFTLDESTFSRELAPLAGHYPALFLGPPWWFHDSPEGLRRFRELTTETAGFRNTVGFNDDTRAFLSIPARHDVARRVDAGFLARLVAEHRLDLDEAHDTLQDLTSNLVRRAYKL